VERNERSRDEAGTQVTMATDDAMSARAKSRGPRERSELAVWRE